MGGCASKSAVVGSEQLSEQQAPTESSSSLTCKPQSAPSGVTPSTGSQLRTAAKTAWQTSARNLRMSLSRSRRRQESYRIRHSNKDDDVESDGVEEEELDSAGNGGRPGVCCRGTKSPGHASGPRPLAGSASHPVSGSVAWDPPGFESAEPPRGRRARFGSETAADGGRGEPVVLGRVGSTAGKTVTIAAADEQYGSGDADRAISCVQSFHGSRKGGMGFGRAETDEALPNGESPTFAVVNGRYSAAAGGGDATTASGGGDVGGRRKAGVSSPDGAATGPVPASKDRDSGASAPGGGAPRAPRTSSPSAHDIATRRARGSVGGDGGWTAPIGPGGGAGGGRGPLVDSSALAVDAAAAAANAAADAAAAAACGAAAAAAGGSGSQERLGVQWVIRPGPPVESVYGLGEVLGRGSFGVVRSATHLVSGARVAVKSIRKSLLGASDVSALRREVEILHHLSGHPHISQLLGVFEEPQQLHLVMELYQGGDLFDATIAVGRHSERAAADVMRTVLTAVSYCHAMGVAHRDIKPENFMLTAPLPAATVAALGAGAAPEPVLPLMPQQYDPVEQLEQVEELEGGAGPSWKGGAATAGGPTRGSAAGATGAQQAAQQDSVGSRLKLIDFGLSAFCSDAAPMTDTVGTSYYVAPEVLAKCYSRSADIWSAGVILHILLTGYAPFDGHNDQEILRAVQMARVDMTLDPIWSSISREATAVLTAMLERDPTKRATADQLLSMPWLGRTAAACTASTAPLPGVVSDRMRRFARMHSFKKEARRVVAGLMRPEEVAGLVAQFKGIDADGDGKLSVQELREGLTRQEMMMGPAAAGRGPAASPGGTGLGAGRVAAGGVRGPLGAEELLQLVERTDLDGDGQLDQSEFLGAALPTSVIARQAQQALAAAQMAAAAGRGRNGVGSASATVAAAASNPLAAAFAHFDADGSGFITADELRSALAGHHPTGRGPDVKALLSQVDRDADGRISYPEFLEMMVQEVDEDEVEQYDTASRARAAANKASRQAPPGPIRRETVMTVGADGGRRAAAQRLRGGVGGAPAPVPPPTAPSGSDFRQGGGRGGGKPGTAAPATKVGNGARHHHPQYDEDMVPYEILPTDVRGAHFGAAAGAAGGRGGGPAGRGRGPAGAPAAIDHRRTNAAWGVGGAPSAAATAAAAAAAIRARREAATAAASRGAPQTSFKSTAILPSNSGGVSSLDWSDDCNGRGDDGTSLGEMPYVGGRTAAAAGGGAGGYVPSRLAVGGDGGGGGAGQILQAAEAAALNLMSHGGEDPDSLLQQLSVSGVEPHAATAAATPTFTAGRHGPGVAPYAPQASGLSVIRPSGGSEAGRPPAILIPQPAASTRARRHSAAEVLEDDGYGDADSAAAADGGWFGVVTERAPRQPRMSEVPHLLYGSPQQKPAGGLGRVWQAQPPQLPQPLAQQAAHPSAARSRLRQVQPAGAEDGGPASGAYPSGRMGGMGGGGGAGPSPLQYCPGRGSTGGAPAQPSGQRYGNAGRRGAGPQDRLHPAAAAAGDPAEVAGFGAVGAGAAVAVGDLLARGDMTARSMGASMVASRRRQCDNDDEDLCSGGGGAAADSLPGFAVLPPGTCAEDFGVEPLSNGAFVRQRNAAGSSLSTAIQPLQHRRDGGGGGGVLSEPLPVLRMPAPPAHHHQLLPRNQSYRGVPQAAADSWSESGGAGPVGVAAGRQRPAGGVVGGYGLESGMVLRNLQPLWEEEN